MLSMKRRNMKGKHVTDSGSENVDAEKTDEAPKDPEVLMPSNPDPAAESPRAQNVLGLRFTEHSGPPWANPEILRDLSPKDQYDLMKSGLESARKRDENEFQFAKEKLASQTEGNKRSQWFGLGVLIIVLLACGGLSWLFLTFGAKELITPVLTGLGGLGAGFAGGYGFGRKSGRDS